MWEALLGSAITPTIQAGVGEAATQALTPAITDEAIGFGLNNALTNGMSNIGTNTMGQVTPQMLQGAGKGLFDTLGGFGKTLMSDQAGNAFNALGGLYQMYNQGQAFDQAKNIQNEQMALAKDAYNRDKTADERRQKLVF